MSLQDRAEADPDDLQIANWLVNRIFAISLDLHVAASAVDGHTCGLVDGVVQNLDRLIIDVRRAFIDMPHRGDHPAQEPGSEITRAAEALNKAIDHLQHAWTKVVVGDIETRELGDRLSHAVHLTRSAARVLSIRDCDTNVPGRHGVVHREAVGVAWMQGRAIHLARADLVGGRNRHSVGGHLAEGTRWWRGHIEWPHEEVELRDGTEIVIELDNGRSAPAVTEPDPATPEHVSAIRGIGPPPFDVP